MPAERKTSSIPEVVNFQKVELVENPFMAIFSYYFSLTLTAINPAWAFLCFDDLLASVTHPVVGSFSFWLLVGTIAAFVFLWELPDGS